MRTDTVLEPGAGQGTITGLLASEAGKVLAVEKDHRLVEELRTRFHDQSNVTVLEGDVLKLDLPVFEKIVGTPPYYISSRLVLLMIRENFRLASLVFQEEFGRRLVASPGSRDYGRLSVVAQRNLAVEIVDRIPRRAFRPSPRVDSALLRIQKKSLGNVANVELYASLVRGLFTQRRRLVRGALKHWLEKCLGKTVAEKIMTRLSVPDSRVFQLSPDDFERLTDELANVLAEEQVRGFENRDKG